MDISFLWSNDLINVSVIAWVSAQLIKAVVDTVKHKQFDRHRLAGAGGMPSSHSAVTCAVLLTSYYLYGFNSSTFALAFVVALIVMYDATGVRWAAGLHARAINQLVEYLNNSEDQENKNALAELIPRLNESLGHRVIEVICGALLGFAIAFIAHLIRQGGVFLF
ncbi:MAG TPA: divergent PAP2 family protein [Candidatus Acutalibacter stercorigallinarum]|nr:divergent PAP2 family protein [Candidatus Acutalibacter stercorigallinarum]